jgi:hypothetical protein
LGAVKNIYKLTLFNDVIGVIVVTYPHLALKGRNVFNNKKYAKMTKENCTAINREYECIARVILHPQYRGLGLAYYMLKEYFKLSDSPFIETVAVMANYTPFFEKAGMTRIDVEPDQKRIASVKELENFGFNVALISSERYNETVYNQLTEEEQIAVKEIVRKVLNRYKGQIVKLFSKDKSLDDIVNTELFRVMKELQRADIVYLVIENKKEE